MCLWNPRTEGDEQQMAVRHADAPGGDITVNQND